jgi:hypothetical protein
MLLVGVFIAVFLSLFFAIKLWRPIAWVVLAVLAIGYLTHAPHPASTKPPPAEATN